MDEYIWIELQKTDSSVPIGAHILGVFDNQIKVKDDDNNELWVTRENILGPMHSTAIFGVENMIHLGELKEYSLLRNLQIRFMKDLIYTYIGSILVSVNPYKSLPIYDRSKMLEYRKKRLGELPPHLFAAADLSYESMRENLEKRCIVISGESGAGKTESTKIFLQYFAGISSRQSGKEKQILESNPILEAFGNAKTAFNNNSSRFGKYIAINFASDGSIHSAGIKQYLLEKSRIVSQNKNEQNYHIFYSLMIGTSAEEKRRLGLQYISSYNYLNKATNFSSDEINKICSISKIKSAMKVLNFSDDEIWSIFEIIAAILQFGNLEFKSISKDNTESATITSDREIWNISSQLGVTPEILLESLTKKTISPHDDKIFKLLTKQEALDYRDAFVKKIYENLFNFIVSKINSVLQETQKPSNSYIGLLDIFGFEAFEKNNFEQFCINYASEQLQQFFISHIFKMEQENYINEKITWKFINYPDNTETLNLIKLGNMSILSVINDESKVPKGTDKTMLDKLVRFHSGNSNFIQPKHPDTNTFGIKHFAGIVFYDVCDFLEKNRDACHLDIKKMVESSENSFLRQIFSADFEASSQRYYKKRTETLTLKFKNSLDLLMDELNECQPFFVRCIKPNEMKKPNKFDRMFCMKQLRYSGLMETTKIRAAGYPVQYDYVQFVQRYRVFCTGIPLAHKTDCKQATMRICDKVFREYSKVDYKLGRTKIFMKQMEESLLENKRNNILNKHVIVIQTAVRGWLQRRRYRKMKEKMYLLKKEREEKQQQLHGMNARDGFHRLQQKVRRLSDEFQHQRQLVTRFQAHCRGFLIRKLLKKKMEKKQPNNSNKDEEKTDSSFSFQNFSQKYFQNKHDHRFYKKPITSSLTRLEQSEDIAAAKALWVTILRYTGHISEKKKIRAKISTKRLLGEIFKQINNSKEVFTKAEKAQINKIVDKQYDTWLQAQTNDLDKLHFIVGHGITRSELRDEIYCQICKTITKNPSKTAATRGWNLLSSCTGCFPPSDLFLKYLKNFIREGPQKYISYCLFRLHRTIQNGSRAQPPCHTEFQAIAKQKPVELNVILVTTDVISVKVDSTTTVRETLETVTKTIEINDNFGFSLVLEKEMKHLSLGDGHTFILDYISECEQYAMEIGDNFESVPWKLYLKKEMFAPWHDYTVDNVSTKLICTQIIEGVKAGVYTCDFDDLCQLIVQFCYLERGKHNFVPNKIIDLFIPHYFYQEPEDRVGLLKEVVGIRYQEMFDKEIKDLDLLRGDIVKYAMTKWILEFSRFFEVFGSVRNQNGSFSYPQVPIIVAVNSSGIFIIDETNEKRIISKLFFMEIKEIFRKEMVEGKGYILTIRSYTGLEILLEFQTINCDLHELLVKILENMRKFSKFVICNRSFKSTDGSFLTLEKGDLIMLSHTHNGKDLLQNIWAEGFNFTTQKTGNFLLEHVEIISTAEKPPESLLIAMRESILSGKGNHLSQHIERLKHYTLKSYASNNFRAQTSKKTLRKGNKNKPVELWRYSPLKIYQPLHAKLQNNEKLSAKAVESFNAILTYTEGKVGVGSLENDERMAKEIFEAALQSENDNLKDELYCQIMKQLTSNPNREKENRTWELMWMITGLFPCQNNLEKEVKKFLQSRRTIQAARECLTRFNKVLYFGPRKHPPHLIEIDAARHRPCQIFYKFYFPDDTYKYFQINSLTKTEDMNDAIISRLGMNSIKGFGLFLFLVNRLFEICEQFYLFDYFQFIKMWTEKNKLSGANYNYQIFFMKKTWKDVVPGQDSFVDLKFIYPQEYDKYIQGYHQIPVEDLGKLAALLYKIYATDQKQSIEHILPKIIPPYALKLKKSDVWKKEIQLIHSTQASLSKEECKVEFLKYLYILPSYGVLCFGKKSPQHDLSNYILYPVSNTSLSLI